MLFRIENTSDCDAVRRTYNPNDFQYPELDASRLDAYIAEEIRKEVNGAADRNVLSYSKSLAVCLLKYNPYADNELHLLPSCWREGDSVRYATLNSLRYTCGRGDLSSKGYSILSRITRCPWLSLPYGSFTLLDFIVDVSNNALLDEYLRRYTPDRKGKSSRVSPEKDREVLVMNPPVDFTVSGWNKEAVYVLYAQHMKYGFLNHPFIRDWLINQLNKTGLDAHEITAFVKIIYYLSKCWQYEFKSSQKIYAYLETTDKGAFCYHGVNFFENILNADPNDITNFEDAWAIDCDYQHSSISELCWQACYRYLNARKRSCEI